MLGDVAMFENRRKHPRISIQTELWIGQDGIFTRTSEHLRDLSVGGAFIQCEEVYPIGSVLSLRFKMPGAVNMISCSGIVRNMRLGEGFGVQFLDLSRENARFIEERIGHQGESAANY